MKKEIQSAIRKLDKLALEWEGHELQFDDEFRRTNFVTWALKARKAQGKKEAYGCAVQMLTDLLKNQSSNTPKSPSE